MSALGHKRTFAVNQSKNGYRPRPIADRQCPKSVRAALLSLTSCWLHLSRGIDFGFLGDRLSICLTCVGVLPRMSYPRRSSSAIASRLSSSTVFLRGAMMADRIGTPEPPSLCQPSQKVRFLLAIREIYRQDY